MLIGKVLGSTEIEVDGVVADLGGPLPRRLVTALLAAEGRPVAEPTLAEAIWGDEAPASPTSSLQANVSRLRRTLGRPALARAGEGYRLAVDDTDAARFAADVRRGRELLADERPGEALRLFDSALARWRGDAYADLPHTYARPALEELRAVAEEERLAARLTAGDAPGVTGDLEAAVTAQPYRERRWELLILALYRGGRQADSLAALRRVRKRLADDLGIDPGPALQELEGRLLAQDPGLLLASRPAPAVRPLSHFFGRAAELAALSELLASARLVTLVGPGGAGKTRLAIEYAAARDPWFVRLADVTEPALVPAAVAAAAGVRGATTDAIATALGDRPGLLLLDNCEHVVAAAAELTLGLLARCPRLRVLATSREPLAVDGERLLPVAPLPAADAIALLTDRITAVRPGWRPGPEESATLTRLAAALDGIPLALELAAARARVLGLAELLDMLHDRFPALGPVPRGALAPHETLEAAVAWSVDLLGADDRAMLLRLWPFEGGFPLSAVEDDLDALSSLVARSVVVADTTVTPARYRLLEIVRAYCRQHDPDREDSRERHAAWVRRLVERHAPLLRGDRSAHSVRLLNRELANLRAGIVHDLGVRPAAALRTAGLLEWLWFRGGLVAEGLPLLRAALAAAPDAPATDRARAHLGASMLRYMSGDQGATDDLYEGLDLLGDGPDHDGAILATQAAYYESLYWSFRGDFERAIAPARRSIARSTTLGEEWIRPAAEMSLGAALAGAGELDEGRRVLAAAREQAIARGQGWTAAMCGLLLARALLARPAQPGAALSVVREALDLFDAEDDVGNVLAGLHTGAYAMVLTGRVAEAARLLVAVRRAAGRRGLDPDLADPIRAAALAAAIPQTELEAAEGNDDQDESALLALLGPKSGNT
ncbi:BTAD domain-containing putative transcriptional regulator [Paractinoplanes lichenicola]|uniref:Winged helix-turn-helix domain-containing protein n=1 Tax=Paractinoplanes lichenicola TaxID=2802976 RepID=A0ABS1VG18_9ACTN|nr:BTAD domain-containing putative transcriptional regulator [Actinoplanes lichenicola]MBL7253643.1 winged helix-turn-helix domain-containing protein [Actinoplanes lichenicola]